ncbi:MAG: restriction endonuclease subunit S [Phycisphaeraceae bacterium]|nr:MAG: restriction endonuclease subunit S [Phycisphaeraceae bacterium]
MALDPWPTVSIGEVCDGIFDGPHATPAKIDSGAVFLGIWNIENGRIDLSTTEHISEADWPRWTRRVEPTEGDLVFSYETKLGCGALIPAGLRCCLGRRMALARPNRRKVDSRFLLYTFLAPDFQECIRNYTISGSTVDRIPLLEFPKFPIRLPPLPEQRAIARVLGALDNKIELNRRMNRTLKDMARALFSDWLERMESELETVTTQSLTDSGVLVIGDGYRAKRSELRPTGLPFARAGNIDGGFQFTDCEYMGVDGVQAAGDKLSRPLDSVFTSKGTVGRLALVSNNTPTFVYAPQLCFWRAADPSRLNPFVLHQWMHGDEFGEQVDMTKGQTDMADYVSLTDQRRMRITLPSPKRQAEVGRHLERLYGMMDQNTTQIGTLAALRDSLLPVLLSGELRLHHVSAVVKEVVA